MALYTLPSDAVWFITGCSSGIGAALATRLATRTDNRVVATARQIPALSYLADDAPNVLKVALDVTSPEAVDAAFNKAVECFGRVDVVVNNAGYTLVGDTETSTTQEARDIFDTNFWGTVDVTKRALRVLRDENPKTGQRGGAILFVSSLGGFIGTPGSAYYHASKFAMEGFAESVGKEMDPSWNIHFSIIEPGGTSTDFLSRGFRTMATRHPAYAAPDSPTNIMLRMMQDPQLANGFSSADDLARAMWELLTSGKRIPIRVPVGNDSWNVVMDETENVKKELEAWKDFSCSFGGSIGTVEKTVLAKHS